MLIKFNKTNCGSIRVPKMSTSEKNIGLMKRKPRGLSLEKMHQQFESISYPLFAQGRKRK